MICFELAEEDFVTEGSAPTFFTVVFVDADGGTMDCLPVLIVADLLTAEILGLLVVVTVADLLAGRVMDKGSLIDPINDSLVARERNGLLNVLPSVGESGELLMLASADLVLSALPGVLKPEFFIARAVTVVSLFLVDSAVGFLESLSGGVSPAV